MRDAIVDSVTGATTLRFMHTYTPFDTNPDERAHLVCTDYILPAPSSSSPSTADKDEQQRLDEIASLTNRGRNTIVRNIAPVLPITVVSHDIFSVEGQWQGNLIDVSHDGFVRGVCIVSQRLEDDGGNADDASTSAEARLSPFTDMTHNFTVDATGEHCVAEFGEIYIPWDELQPSRYYEYAFDGKRGRISFTKWNVLENNSAGQPVDRDVLAIAIDFK